MRCQACGYPMEPSVGDEAEAYAEMVATFGELPRDEQAIVCDPCYRQMMAWAQQAGLVP